MFLIKQRKSSTSYPSVQINTIPFIRRYILTLVSKHFFEHFAGVRVFFRHGYTGWQRQRLKSKNNTWKIRTISKGKATILFQFYHWKSHKPQFFLCVTLQGKSHKFLSFFSSSFSTPYISIIHHFPKFSGLFIFGWKTQSKVIFRRRNVRLVKSRWMSG